MQVWRFTQTTPNWKPSLRPSKLQLWVQTPSLACPFPPTEYGSLSVGMDKWKSWNLEAKEQSSIPTIQSWKGSSPEFWLPSKKQPRPADMLLMLFQEPRQGQYLNTTSSSSMIFMISTTQSASKSYPNDQMCFFLKKIRRKLQKT